MSEDGIEPFGGRLVGSRHVMTVRVYYEDTDFSGVAYHGAYVRYLDRGRTEILRAIAFDHQDLFTSRGEGFVVRRMTLDYVRPARMDDVLTVTTEPEDVKGASLVLRQGVLRGEETLLTGAVQCVYVRNGRPVRMPDMMRRRMMGE
ncbi:tol-pal system-associated acyl-CoA thioesterase [Hansschlegelia quercus]